ncbi:MAG: hypothetical protein L0Y66_07780 [Myxococcaceae bacterium]|nr:hypothetical protein [Myxococcaceae bacterium]MCI0672090.1 hypothetical protein [Myxococcaceae bacterium]
MIHPNPNGVKHGQELVPGANGGARSAVLPASEGAQGARQGVLTVVAFMWGFWFLLLGVLMIGASPVGGAVTAALGVLGFGYAFHLLANGQRSDEGRSAEG